MDTDDDKPDPPTGARQRPDGVDGAEGADIVLSAGAITGRGNSVNAFVVLDDAQGFIEFVTAVFDGAEVSEARARTPAGRLIHAEVRVADALLLLADTQPGWHARPGLLQVWVSDAAGVLVAASRRGATVITPVTPFYGQLVLARIEDPWRNLWWLFQPAPGQPDPTPVWEGGSNVVFATIDNYLRQPAIVDHPTRLRSRTSGSRS